MYDLKKALAASPLFKNFTEKDISDMLVYTNYKISSFSKNQTIAIEGDPITSIGIILEGSIEVQITYPSGRTVTVTRMSQGNVFGEVILFSQKKQYPSTIVSSSNSKIMFISKDDIINFCTHNKTFLTNLMGLLSNRILMLNSKLKNISYQTIRKKIANYLLEEYKRQKSHIIRSPLTRKEMAEHFGTTRPSLSRELTSMKKDGLIDFDKNTITIKKLDQLEETLF